MTQQVFYIHGGSSYSNYEDYLYDLQNQELHSASNEESKRKWPSTLRTQLGEGYEVFMPSMPNSENAKYEEWKIWFERYFEFLRDGVVLVCWSQGAMFVTRYLTENKLPVSIKHLFLLAGPYDFYVSEECREDGGDFYAEVECIPEITRKVEHITIMHSKDDFVVPYEHALKFKEALPEAELVTFEDKNHFLVEKFPELIERITAVAGE